MIFDTLVYSDSWLAETSAISNKVQADLVFVFGDSDILSQTEVFNDLQALYPNAQIVGASSAGNILGDEIHHAQVVATAVRFEKSSVAVASVNFSAGDDVDAIAERLISQLPQDNLRHIFVLSDGLNINGSALVRGINKLTDSVTFTGGMAGDGERFKETWVVANAPAEQFCIVVVGFYGENLAISSGCFAGWSEFGGDRLVTKSSGNILYELDNEPALKLYKKYLGKYADELPESGMRFPLSIKHKENDPEVIRTLLGINEDDNSIIFAGDIPEGYTVRLMKPKIDLLIDGAKVAAQEIDKINDEPSLGLVVSCSGRRTVMQDLVEEELEIVGNVLGKNTQLTGFYSYGEIAPFSDDIYHCELHNQTLTLTVIYEK
ncbi:MAG: FIST C-terminal domain-containing protein [Gammaproteobacteria bacterium]|nr:FIST C-terminal domain-containing protein [Gammaproteobacteria bacterium]